MIKIGIESTIGKLRSDLLTYPAKYFFILILDNQAALCIRTCDSQGEDMKAHVIDGLVPNSEGKLVSLFEDSIRTSMLEHEYAMVQFANGDEFNITASLEEKISQMPGLINWILSSVLNEDRHIIIRPSWAL